MDNRGASPLRIVLIAAAVLSAVMLVFLGQIGIGIAAILIVVILAAALLFARAKTPTD